MFFGIFFIFSVILIKKYQKKKKISFFKIILYFFEKSISHFNFFVKFLNSLNSILFYADIPAFIFILLFIKFFPLLGVLKKISILFKKDCSKRQSCYIHILILKIFRRIFFTDKISKK